MFSCKKLATVAVVALAGIAGPAFAEDAVVAKVGDTEIHQSELDLAVANLDPQLAQLPDDQKKVAALSSIIDVKLFVDKAKGEKLDQTDDYKARMKFLGDRELHNAYFRKHIVDTVSADEVKARYEKELADLPKQQEVHARHILVATEDEAKAVIAALDKGEDFAKLAKEKSSDSNKDEGGDLGFFGQGRMVPEFEEAAFALEPGTYTKTPVKTQFGYHVIKVEEKRDVAPPKLEDVEPQVRQLVMREKYLAALDEAKKAAKVEIEDEALRKGYDEVNK